MNTYSKSINTFLFHQTPIEGTTPNVGLLLMRVYAGITAMSAGLDKLPMPEWMVEQVITIGFPFPMFFAWLACFVEFAFGLLLTLGLMTRLSATLLAITFGTAAFGFHKVLPLVDMHIAQHFFWMFVLLATIGAGKYAIDYLINQPESSLHKRRFFVGIPAFTLLLAVALLLEITAPVPVENTETTEISSINIPGSFNNWDPTANSMTPINATEYVLDVDFEQAGLINFKFTANQSWDINLGIKSDISGFPLQGIAELDQGNTTQNIRAYIPKSGTYRFKINKDTYAFELDSLGAPVTP